MFYTLTQHGFSSDAKLFADSIPIFVTEMGYCF